MTTTIKKTDLRHGWYLAPGLRVAYQSQAAPATEPRHYSCDPAFGDFNLPLLDGCMTAVAPSLTEEADDVIALQEAIDEGDFEPYSEFRRDELGM